MSLYGTYPLVLEENTSISISARATYRSLQDFTIAGQTSDREVIVGQIALNGSHEDDLGLGGITNFSLSFLTGHSDQNLETARLQDAVTRDAFGSFSKLNYAVRRLQLLPGKWYLDLSSRGQFAFDNLDSSERFSLGGAEHIRAYPMGEAGEDSGHIVSANLFYRINRLVRASVFVDAGYTENNYETWADWNAFNPNQENSYTLAGAGASLAIGSINGYILTASIATPLGNNPGRDLNGNDSDGRDPSFRGWLSITSEF